MSREAAETARLIDPDDRKYVAAIADLEQRSVVAESLLRHRAPEWLRAGDRVPSLMLTRLEPYGHVLLDEVAGGQPAVLVFGSYT